MQRANNGGVDPRKATIWADADGIIHVRNSERGTLDKCPQRWWWAWREGLRPKETATPLWFGTAIHEALADYYQPGVKRSKDYIDKFRESADMEAEYVRVNLGGLDEDKWVDARALGEQMLRGYTEHYGRDRHWDVIATEQSFELRIPWLDPEVRPLTPVEKLLVRRLQKRGIETRFFILNGTFDGVYRDRDDRKRTKLMEHKTAASIGLGHLTMDNQAGTYHLVAQSVGRSQGWLGSRENITEITYNFLRKGMPDDRPRDSQGYATNNPTKAHFVLALEEAGIEWPKNPTLAVFQNLADEHKIVVVGDRSKRQPAPLYMRHAVKKTPSMRRTQLERLQGDVTEMAVLESGMMTVRKSPNKDTCSFCEFRDMCELHETEAGWVEYRNAMFRRTDPYADHRKSA